MNTTAITTLERRHEAEERLHELPPLGPADRLALRLGLRLLLRAERSQQRRALRADRRHDDGHADRATRSTFEHRTWAGPTW